MLSELILTKIDFELTKKWGYIRNIDDYVCYTNTYEEAEMFIGEVSKQLKVYELALNYKKTKICELPVCSEDIWIQEINSLCCYNKSTTMNYNDIKNYFDLIIGMFKRNDENSAIFNYAIKVLSSKKLTLNGEKYFKEIVFHLVLIYPYLIPLLEKYVFDKLIVNDYTVKNISELIYEINMKNRNYEGASYALYYAIKYNFGLDKVDFFDVEKSEDCVLFTALFLYDKKVLEGKNEKLHIDLAKKIISSNDINRYWLYVYEVLSTKYLKDDWKKLKQAGVTFVKNLDKF